MKFLKFKFKILVLIIIELVIEIMEEIYYKRELFLFYL